MPKLTLTKEERKTASEYGYNLGVQYRQRLIAWIKNLFRRS
jgi:hypothetical protein